jgi:tRNA A-37 threonylcarbamoyl transferase component Bud32/tetratricopeptide (TPR) repeat protein
VSGDANMMPGARLGPYTLGPEIGSGATATVYLGTDVAGRSFAVKVRRRGQPELDRRFLREFESMRLLRVAGVVPVHEAGIEDAHLWFSMDRVHGLAFHTPIHALGTVEGRVRTTIELGRKLCQVLASLHEAGFVHRDIKPTNVLVDDTTDVHVLDFGIGRYFSDQDTLSATGEVLGTVPYMAPEQLGGLPSGEGVDLFATGLMLHEAIAGPRHRPLTTVGWIPKICLERLPSLASLFREVPRGLSHLVDALLAPDPTDRPTAREAAVELHRVAGGVESCEWPSGPFVDPGDWWSPLEGTVGHGEHAPVWVLEGATGSGRRRLAEQLHRMALLQGTWTIHLRCRIDRVGGPVIQLVERLIADLDDASLAQVVGDASIALRQMWPHLPLPMPPSNADPATAGRIGTALRGLVERACADRAMLLVIRDLEQVDPLTARLLPLIAPLAGENLGVVLIHESRWSTPLSRDLVATLHRDQQAGVLRVPKLAPEAADAIASQVCPTNPGLSSGGPTPPTFSRPVSPTVAVEAAWRALGAWRGEALPGPEASLWPVALLGEVPVPLDVYRSLCGEGAEDGPWVDYDDDGVTLAGPSAELLARSRLTNLERSAAALARAWERHAPDDRRAGELARLWLLASDPDRAIAPATRAAVHAERFELYPEARQWLLLLDSLPRAAATDQDPDTRFELAVVRARVSLYTDVHTFSPALLDAAEQFARTEDQQHRVRLLRVEYGLRQGEPRAALVAALRVGSSASGAPGPLQAQALLLAFRSRIVLGQLEEAARDLDRAEALLASHPDPMLAVRTSNARAELARTQQDLLWCRALCQQNIRSASQHRYLRGVGEAMHRLGQVLRMLGRRREAEHQVRSARDAVAETGDAVLDAETGLALATLLVERGEQLPARHLLDATIRRIRGLSLDHLLPSGMRLALQIATLAGEPTDASVAIAGIEEVRGVDAETPAALVHWWRTRGDISKALDVVGPDDRGYGRVLWRVERARAAMVAGRSELAREDLDRALDRASNLGFAELQTYARIVQGAFLPVDDDVWAELLRKAARSMFTEVFLGAVEMDARRLTRADPVAARTKWRGLLARARELGYRPGVQEAEGWLGDTGARL